MKTKIIMWVSILVMFASLTRAAVILHESFVTGSNPATGEYGTGNLRDVSPSAAGGTIVGFSSSNPWRVNTSLPEVTSSGLSSAGVTGVGGGVKFRGLVETNLGTRAAIRTIDAYTTPANLFFSGTLSANKVDDDALSFIAFTQPDITDDAVALHILGSAGSPGGYVFDGVAFGFKGDGSGGMDLVIRYRGADSIYVDTILVDNVAINTAYTVAGQINWNASGNDSFIVGVNGTYFGSLIGQLGTGANISQAVLTQRNYGFVNYNDGVIMDELQLASTYEDLGSIIPEPATIGLFGIGALAAMLIRRRTR